jgi:hypothetical protein
MFLAFFLCYLLGKTSLQLKGMSSIGRKRRPFLKFTLKGNYHFLKVGKNAEIFN